MEGINFSRGKQLEKSSYFDRDRLIDWLMIELPILKNAKYFSACATREQTSGKVKFTSVHASSSQLSVSELKEVDEVLLSVRSNSKAKTKLINTLTVLE